MKGWRFRHRFSAAESVFRKDGLCLQVWNVWFFNSFVHQYLLRGISMRSDLTDITLVVDPDGNGSQKGSQRGSQKESFGSQKGSHLGQVNLVF